MPNFNAAVYSSVALSALLMAQLLWAERARTSGADGLRAALGVILVGAMLALGAAFNGRLADADAPQDAKLHRAATGLAYGGGALLFAAVAYAFARDTTYLLPAAIAAVALVGIPGALAAGGAAAVLASNAPSAAPRSGDTALLPLVSCLALMLPLTLLGALAWACRDLPSALAHVLAAVVAVVVVPTAVLAAASGTAAMAGMAEVAART